MTNNESFKIIRKLKKKKILFCFKKQNFIKLIIINNKKLQNFK